MSNYNKPLSEPFRNRPSKNSYFDNFTKKDKILSILGVLLLIGSLNGGPPIFFAIAIFGWVFYTVSQRERSKERILNILHYQPDTTLSYIANHIDKSENYVTEVLKIMILDEGAPIRFDLINKTVKKVGDMYPHQNVASQEVNQNTGRQSSSAVDSNQVPGPTTQNQEAYDDQDQVGKMNTVPQSSQNYDSQEPIMHNESCLHCGIELPSIAKFCHECGVRQ